VVRGGYGLFYDSGILVINSSLYFNPPLFSVRAFFPDRHFLITLTDPFPANGGITPPASPNTIAPDIVSGSLHQWNFTVERQLYEFDDADCGLRGFQGHAPDSFARSQSGAARSRQCRVATSEPGLRRHLL
jgi:hypothetical protein